MNDTPDRPKAKKPEVHTMTVYQGNGRPILAQTFNRNATCSCGSGKKAKHCCGVNTRYFTPKPKPNGILNNGRSQDLSGSAGDRSPAPGL